MQNSNIKPQWYCLVTLPGCEQKAISNLRSFFSKSYQDQVLDIKMVETEEIVEKDGKKKKVVKNKFKGYIFIKMIYTPDLFSHIVVRENGVINFCLGNPKPLGDDEVIRMGLESPAVEGDNSLKEGDSVRIVTGPLEGFSGKIEKIDIEKNTAKVIVIMFGRETPVDVDCNIIEKFVAID